MNSETLFFFEKQPEMLPVYEAFEKKVRKELEDVSIRVQKTQITFSHKRVFACVSFLPVKKAAQRPPHYLVITFGLGHPVTHPRIAAAVEPYPNRWTHHVMLSSVEELDDELMGWVREAWEFSGKKR